MFMVDVIVNKIAERDDTVVRRQKGHPACKKSLAPVIRKGVTMHDLFCTRSISISPVAVLVIKIWAAMLPSPYNL